MHLACGLPSPDAFQPRVEGRGHRCPHKRASRSAGGTEWVRVHTRSVKVEDGDHEEFINLFKVDYEVPRRLTCGLAYLWSIDGRDPLANQVYSSMAQLRFAQQ